MVSGCKRTQIPRQTFPGLSWSRAAPKSNFQTCIEIWSIASLTLKPSTYKAARGRQQFYLHSFTIRHNSNKINRTYFRKVGRACGFIKKGLFWWISFTKIDDFSLILLSVLIHTWKQCRFCQSMLQKHLTKILHTGVFLPKPHFKGSSLVSLWECLVTKNDTISFI